jgi:signal transduction histidine kinase
MSFAKALRRQLGRLGRLDTLYFALAGIDLITICSALALNHATMTAFERSVQASSQWSARQTGLVELTRLAQAVDAPPNDIFETRDVPRERRRLTAATIELRRRMDAALVDFGTRRLSAHDDAILHELRSAAELLPSLETHAEATLQDFEQGRPSRAATHMAVADRAFGVFANRLESASRILEFARGEFLQHQLAIAERMRMLEFVFAVALTVIVSLVLIYGRRIALMVRTEEARRSAMLSDLAVAKEKLRRYADDVSHELRGPISKMRLDAEVLIRQPRTAGEYQTGVESILIECNHLSAIVESLLFLARAENTAVELKREMLSLDRELAMIADYFEAAAEQAGVALVVERASGAVWADRTLLLRAVSNLVRNALTHTPPGSRVSLVGTATDKLSTIEVRDNGPGIAPELQTRLFDRFQRGDTASGGAGLGLAIVKSIMDLHGGEVVIANDGGARATLTFPSDAPSKITAS